MGPHFSPIRITLEHLEHQNWINLTWVAWRVFITAKQFITKPRNWVAGLWRLAVQGFTARRFLREPRNTLNCHVLPGGYEHPARRFLKIFQKCAISQNLTDIHLQWFMLSYRINKYMQRSGFSSPNLVSFAKLGNFKLFLWSPMATLDSPQPSLNNSLTTLLSLLIFFSVL